MPNYTRHLLKSMRKKKVVGVKCNHWPGSLFKSYTWGVYLTCAASRCPWPGAVGLTQSDACSMKLETRLTPNSTGSLKVVVAHILDKKAVFWRDQCWAVNHWKRKSEKIYKVNIIGTIHYTIKNYALDKTKIVYTAWKRLWIHKILQEKD